MKKGYLVLICLVVIFFGCEHTTNSKHALKSTSSSAFWERFQDTVMRANRNFRIGDSVTAYLLIDTTFGKSLATANRWANDQEYYNELSDPLLKIDFVIVGKKLIYTKGKPRCLDDIHFSGSVISVHPSGVFYGNDKLETNTEFELSIVSYGRCFQSYKR